MIQFCMGHFAPHIGFCRVHSRPKNVFVPLDLDRNDVNAFKERFRY